MKKLSLVSLLRKVHEDEAGVVSLETILIIGAIALPILIYLIMKAWPAVRNYFETGMNDLQTDPSTAGSNGSTLGN
jgi:hypothetical protein